MQEEFRQRLVSEYRYAITKMQEATNQVRKLFYFSVFFAEAQRIFNWKWDNDLALTFVITQYVHTQLTGALNSGTIPIDWDTINNKLTQSATEIATYFENINNPDNRKGLCKILGHCAEIGYSVTGNGNYLYEKGDITL
jgi:hypothetical protein